MVRLLELLFTRWHDVDSLELLEGVDWDVSDQSVKFLGRVFVLVSLSVKPGTDSVLNVSDSTFPAGLVQTGVDSDIIGTHGLLGKLSDGINGFWCPVFETDTVDTLVKVDSVFTANNVLDG